MAESEWYQIRLYSRGQIEIFQHVYRHTMHIEKGETKAIEIVYSATQTQGLWTHSLRPMDKVYSVEVIDEPTFDDSVVVPGAKWIINGGLKSQTVIPFS